MNALTIRQPYATAIALGLKRFELRSGPPAGDLCPPGVRPLPGHTVNRGERIAIHAAARPIDWDQADAFNEIADPFGFSLGYYEPDGWNLSGTQPGPDAWSSSNTWGTTLPLGVILGTATLTNAYPVVDAAACLGDQPHVCRDADRLILWNPCSGGANLDEEDISDQLPWAPWTPGQWAWELTDFTPTTERCPACAGYPTRPSHRIEGGSLSCQHCNRTLTFNFMRDGGDLRCSCERARRAACPVCLGAGSCPPIPAKGRQGVWEWTP